MTITRISTSKLKPADYNPPRRSDASYCADLIKSIKDVGQLQPALAYRENGHYRMIDGHRRLAAIMAIGGRTMWVQVVSGDTASHIYSEVNRASKKLSGNDILFSFLQSPDTVTLKVQKELEAWGETARYVNRGGGSIQTLRQASRVAKYADADKHEAAKWLVDCRMTYKVRKAIEAEVPASELAKAIAERKPLVNKWEAPNA